MVAHASWNFRIQRYFFMKRITLIFMINATAEMFQPVGDNEERRRQNKMITCCLVKNILGDFNSGSLAFDNKFWLPIVCESYNIRSSCKAVKGKFTLNAQ